MNIKRLRKNLIILALAVIVGWLFSLDYSDLSWETNSVAYLAIGTMALLAVSGFIKDRNSQD